MNMKGMTRVFLQTLLLLAKSYPVVFASVVSQESAGATIYTSVQLFASQTLERISQVCSLIDTSDRKGTNQSTINDTSNIVTPVGFVLSQTAVKCKVVLIEKSSYSAGASEEPPEEVGFCVMQMTALWQYLAQVSQQSTSLPTTYSENTKGFNESLNMLQRTCTELLKLSYLMISSSKGFSTTIGTRAMLHAITKDCAVDIYCNIIMPQQSLIETDEHYGNIVRLILNVLAACLGKDRLDKNSRGTKVVETESMCVLPTANELFSLFWHLFGLSCKCFPLTATAVLTELTCDSFFITPSMTTSSLTAVMTSLGSPAYDIISHLLREATRTCHLKTTHRIATRFLLEFIALAGDEILNFESIILSMTEQEKADIFLVVDGSESLVTLKTTIQSTICLSKLSSSD